jgi:hypothetical protein
MLIQRAGGVNAGKSNYTQSWVRWDIWDETRYLQQFVQDYEDELRGGRSNLGRGQSQYLEWLRDRSRRLNEMD